MGKELALNKVIVGLGDKHGVAHVLRLKLWNISAESANTFLMEEVHRARVGGEGSVDFDRST